MKGKQLIYASTLCALFFGCKHHDEEIFKRRSEHVSVYPKLDVAALLAQESSIVKNAPQKSNNELAFDLYKELHHISNVVYSPFSISLSLAMAYAGAFGDTEITMKKVLHFGENNIDFHRSYGQFANLLSSKDRSENEATLKISNNQWLQKDYQILSDYLDIIAQSYSAAPNFLDFIKDPAVATLTINEKIKEQTDNEIPKLLKSDLTSDTRFVLTNAIYFNAKWEHQFKTYQTADGEFTTNNKEVITASFMKQIHHYSYSDDDNRQVLLMPYRDNDFAAVFILPREGKMKDVEQSLTADNFGAIFDSLERKKIDLWLPKFSHRTAPNMKQVLSKMGLGIIFDEKEADLSRINGIKTGLEKLYIGDVVHEAVVKIYEAGTTAAAASAVIGIGVTAIPPKEQTVEFHATRPFLFFIVHKESKTILFMGRVDSPLS